MMNNDNMVKIVTNDERVIRKLVEITEEPYIVTVSLEKPEIMNWFKNLIMDGQLQKIQMFPIKNAEEKEETKDEEYIPIMISEEHKKPRGEVTIKERIYELLQELGEARNAEIISRLKIEPNSVSRSLKKLVEEGRVEKLSKGNWRVKETKDSSGVNTEDENTDDEETEKRKEGESPPEKKNENYEVLRQKVLTLFQKGWIVTEDELVEKLNSAKEDLNEILNDLIYEKVIIKDGESYKIYISPFGIFEEKKFQILLDFIMERNYFLENQILYSLPEEYKKLEELISSIGKNYLRRDMSSPEKKYEVILKGRILYYFLKNPNETISSFEDKYQNISKKDIAKAIQIAIKNGELKKIRSDRYVTTKM